MTAPWISVLAEGTQPMGMGSPYYNSWSFTRNRGMISSHISQQQSPLQAVRTSGCSGCFAVYDRTVTASSGSYIQWTNDANVAVVRIRASNTYQSTFEYWNGATWTALGTFTNGYDAQLRFVLNFSGLGTASGSLTLIVQNYLGDAIYATISGTGLNLTSATNIARMKMTDALGGGGGSNNFVSTSEHFIADGVGTSVYVYGHNLAGPVAGTDQTQSSGAVTAVDDYLNGNPDADFLSMDASGQRFSVKANAAPAYGSRLVKAVGFGGRLRAGVSGVNQVKAYLKISGTRYYWGGGTGTIITLTTEYVGYHFNWEVSPVTGVAWTKAAAEDVNMEYGFEVV